MNQIAKGVWVATAIVLTLVVSGWIRYPGSTELPAIRVGVLYSLSGAMAVSESPLADAVQLAIEEINAAGGIKGQKLAAVVADCRSDTAFCAEQAERLITTEKVQVLFGCWTPSCRKAVKPVVEKYQHLLIYSVQHEGMEQSPNILYTGSSPNQQIVPGARWAMQQFGPRVYLLGSDSAFPRTANRIIRDLVNFDNGEVVAERYLAPSGGDMDAAIEDIRKKNPDVVLSTINDGNNSRFFTALKQAQLADLPLLSFSVTENEIQAWGGTGLNQHYVVCNYFQSMPNEENRRFVAAYQARFGANRVTGDPLEAIYAGVHLWAQAAREAGSGEPARVNPALLVQSLRSPSGIAAVDMATRHLWKYARVGKVRPNGQIEEVFASSSALRPDPWLSYRTRESWDILMAGVQP